jgi:hypothetical protein
MVPADREEIAQPIGIPWSVRATPSMIKGKKATVSLSKTR